MGRGGDGLEGSRGEDRKKGGLLGKVLLLPPSYYLPVRSVIW